MKRHVLGIGILVFIGLSVSRGLSSSPQFPIAVWYGPAPSESLERDLFNIRSIGFNQCILNAGSPDQNLNALQVSDSLGLFLFITDNSISRFRSGADTSFQAMDSLTQMYKHHSSFAGYLLEDKPGLSMFPKLIPLTEHFAAQKPEVDYFIQAHPIYASPARLDTSDYRSYLTRFLQDLKPSFLPVEHLALMDESIRPEFFDNLKLLSDLAVEHNTPFWSYVLVVPFGAHPKVTHAHTRVQVYGGLAYGARGVQYYSYRPPSRASGRRGEALLDEEGDVTEAYIFSRDINQEIERVAPVLLNLTPTGVYFSTSNTFGVPELIPGLPVTKIDSPVILTGFFKGPDDRKYVMFVNTDFNFGKRPAIHFSQHVKKIVEVPKHNMSPLQFNWPEKDGSEKSAYILFKAGDGRLFEIIEY